MGHAASRIALVGVFGTGLLTARRSAFLLGSLGVGCIAAYVRLRCQQTPLHVVWDLDNTLLSSYSLSEELEGRIDSKQLLSAHVSDHFDHQSSDGSRARSYVRPYARFALRFVGLFAVQHVFTTAQGLYALNCVRALDPHSRHFSANIVHRDVPAFGGVAPHVKDLGHVVPREDLPRTILIDDRPHNFAAQPRNGLQIAAFEAAADPFNDRALLRAVAVCGLCALALALLGVDTRTVVEKFQSLEQQRYLKATTASQYGLRPERCAPRQVR